MHNLHSNFLKFLKITTSDLKSHLLPDGNVPFYPNSPNTTNIEVVAFSCMAKALSISSKNWLFGILKADYSAHFRGLISRARFNIRRRRLQGYINQVCLSITDLVKEVDEPLIIESIPLPVCANPRIARSTSCKDDQQLQPDRGYHASHKAYYYGFKMQLLITGKGIPVSGTLFPASCHDTQALHYIHEAKRTDCELICRQRVYINQPPA